MLLASPLALLALAPWTALAWWLLRGRAHAQAVPFLHLWPRQPRTTRVHRRRLPPRFVACALLCLFLAILAAAGPELRLPGLARTQLTLVIDRGATMSAAAEGGSTRLADVLHRLPDLLDAAGTPARVTRVQLVPDERAANLDLAQVTRDPAGIQPTAADTGHLLRQVVRDLLHSGESVLLISDRSLAIERARLFQLSPRGPAGNAAVEAVSVDGAQVLVRLSNAGSVIAGRLVVASGEAVVQQEVTLDVEEQADVLLRLPSPPGDVVQARFEAEDDWPADNTLIIARQRTWPAVDVMPGVPAEVRRMAAVYGELRPAGAHARRVRVGSDDSANVIVGEASVRPDGAWHVAAHELTAGVAWESLTDLRAAAWPFGDEASWQVLVRRGDWPLLAIDTSSPGRRVWVGFDSESLRQSPGFVRFWADVLTWANGGPEHWSHREIPSEALASVSLEAALERVGVEETAAGPVAWNVPRARFPASQELAEASLSDWLRGQRRGVKAGPWLLVAALLAAVASAWWWPRSGSG